MPDLPPRRVLLAAYDPTWPARFAEERTRVADALGALPACVEHIGSTAVPGLVAKPVIDILVGRPPATPLAPYVDALRRVGYEYRGENGIPGRHYFRRGVPRAYHLHLVEVDGELWRRHLRFRDLLREDPALAAEYAALKQALAREHSADRAAYTEAKGPFVARVLRAASQSW